ncbi:MAG TPA: LytR C-terminal domain-containing protein [Elusimicrobiota bacterium]|jgi:hypothetical protein|nr:LytR C-terminal domain-containing protein [Elusimicrobiota bacterium]
MEHHRRELIVERLLAAALLAASLGAAWAESASPLAARVREGRPWLAWVCARGSGAEEAPFLSLAVYEPATRRLRLIHVPGDLILEGRRTLDRAYRDALRETKDPGAAARAAEGLAEARLRELSPEPLPEIPGRLAVALAPLAPEDEPAVETASALRAAERRPGTWLALARRAERGLRAGDPAAADPLLFALELRRAPGERLEPARLPEAARAPDFLGRLLAPDDAAGGRGPATVEVLNGAGDQGLASRAAKVLRSKGFDVLATGSAGLRARTLVYDRIGDFARADGARAALGCRSARTVTRLDPSRAVDASIELGADCAAEFGPDDGPQP